MRIKNSIKKALRLDPVYVPRDNNPSTTIPNDVLLPLAIEYINQGHTVTLPLKGNSMRPFLIHMRDKALLTNLKELKVGLPVLAEPSPGHYVLHRIVAINGDKVTLRGDGNIGTEHCLQKDVKALAAGFFRDNRTTPDLIESRKWRIYSWIWMRLLPFRVRLLQLHHIFFRSYKVLDDNG